jgi:hypothetical protein
MKAVMRELAQARRHYSKLPLFEFLRAESIPRAIDWRFIPAWRLHRAYPHEGVMMQIPQTRAANAPHLALVLGSGGVRKRRPRWLSPMCSSVPGSSPTWSWDAARARCSVRVSQWE